MFEKQIKFKCFISLSKENDVHKPWIRVSDDLRGGIHNGTYVQINANGKRAYCQIRGIQGAECRVEINEWYRNILGWSVLPDEVELTIKEANIIGKIRAWKSHPDDIVRIGIGLGAIGIALGLLSIALTLFPPSITALPTNNYLLGLIGTIVACIFALLTAFTLGVGISATFKKY
jgi:hypothetical protein